MVLSFMVSSTFLSFWVLYCSSVHKMTDTQPNYHASFIPKHVTKYEEMLCHLEQNTSQKWFLNDTMLHCLILCGQQRIKCGISWYWYKLTKLCHRDKSFFPKFENWYPAVAVTSENGNYQTPFLEPILQKPFGSTHSTTLFESLTSSHF
jgi:hypothetical protein